jgi:hypothetical protein
MHVLADCMEAVALALLDRAEYSVVAVTTDVVKNAGSDVLEPVVTATETATTEKDTAATVESLLPQLES